MWAALHAGFTWGDVVVVNGAGFTGNILLYGAIRSGAFQAIAIDRVLSNLDIALKIGAAHIINASEVDPVAVINELTNGEGVDGAVEAIGGNGIGLVQALGMVGYNGTLALYGDLYVQIKDFCCHRFHEDELVVRNLNAVHYTKLRSIEHMREEFRGVQQGICSLDIIFQNSVTYSLTDLPQVFQSETNDLETQRSLKTIILPLD